MRLPRLLPGLLAAVAVGLVLVAVTATNSVLATHAGRSLTSRAPTANELKPAACARSMDCGAWRCSSGAQNLPNALSITRMPENEPVERSTFTIDLGAVRRNARRLVDVLGGSELWAVVKADGYGHGARDVGAAALDGGASALCVATVPEALELRRALQEARILVMGPVTEDEIPAARDARLELTVSGPGPIPEGVRVHLKLDTGMGRWGLAELPSPGRDVVGLMSHLASADSDAAFTQLQIARFLEVTSAHSSLTRHLANSAGALRFPQSRLDAGRCGIALYGLSPFGGEAADDGLEPALRWESVLAQVKRLAAGESTGYGRRFVAARPTWIGIVPVGYADGFRRDLTGTEVLVGGERRRVVGTVSMDAFAVELGRELPLGTPVTLVGDGITLDAHARVAGTIGYELACGLDTSPTRARRVVVG